MSLGFLYVAETLAIIFMIVSVVTMIIDSLALYREEFETEEAADFNTVLYDDFETLYINVANGDASDKCYWLECVKGR